jgi:hypothetical protein
VEEVASLSYHAVLVHHADFTSKISHRRERCIFVCPDFIAYDWTKHWTPHRALPMRAHQSVTLSPAARLGTNARHVIQYSKQARVGSDILMALFGTSHTSRSSAAAEDISPTALLGRWAECVSSFTLASFSHRFRISSSPADRLVPVLLHI